MKTKLIFLFVILSSSILVCLGQAKSKANAAESTLIQMEKTAWKNILDKKVDAFAKVLSDDYQGIYPEGTLTRVTEIEQIKQMTFKTADVSDTKVTFPAANTAIVTSIVKMEAMMPDSKLISDNVRATTVFVKRGAQWLVVYHSHVPIRTM